MFTLLYIVTVMEFSTSITRACGLRIIRTTHTRTYDEPMPPALCLGVPAPRQKFGQLLLIIHDLANNHSHVQSFTKDSTSLEFLPCLFTVDGQSRAQTPPPSSRGPYVLVLCQDPMHVRVRGFGYPIPNPWARFRI